MDIHTLTTEERVRFMNLCKEGTEATSRAIATLIKRETGLREVSSPTLVSPSDFASIWGGPDTSLVLIAFGLRGGIKGNLIQIFDLDSAQALIARIQKNDEVPRQLDEKDFAILSEVGNISVSTFITEMMKSVKAPCVPTVPKLVFDGCEQAIQTVFFTNDRSWEQTPYPGFLMKTKFTEEPEIETALYLEIDSTALREFLQQQGTMA